ncbi:MAG: anhydro-N-acetylmuramic acid kinase [Bacteroidota bacterium]
MKERYRVTGLMSGSSMDGVDLAICEFNRHNSQWSYTILAADTLPYPEALREKLEQACNWESAKIKLLDIELGEFYAKLLNDFHKTEELIPDLIASHGHTILHEPDLGITLQAGHGGIMAEKTGIPVVNDFRSADVAQGGEGAPLVPIGDSQLFGTYDACLNLGGIANISYDDSAGQRIAYDLCVTNMALNWIAGLSGLEYDKGGAIARKGQVDKKLLQTLNNLEYYRTKPPKSLGREWFLLNFQPKLDRTNLEVCDLMATTVEHMALQIASGINTQKINSVLVTGGGALNQTLIKRLRYHTSAQIEIPDMLLIQFKEALVFAFLGLLRIRGEINCLSSVTGGKKDLSAGTIYKINNH